MPGDSGVLVVARVLFTNTKRTRDRGCNGHPAFPTPSSGEKWKQSLGRIAPRDRRRISFAPAAWLVPLAGARRGPAKLITISLSQGSGTGAWTTAAIFGVALTRSSRVSSP